MEGSDESGVHMEPAEDDIGSDHSQETTFSQTADLKTNRTLSAATEKSTDGDNIVPWMDSKPNGSGEICRDGLENETIAVTSSKKHRYPYGPLFFIMTATAGQSYSIAGIIAILEFYFARFLYICFGSIDVGLGTASVNIIIGLNQVSGLLGGFLADRVLGNFKTQILSNIISSICAVILIFSTWQYTLNQPSCCPNNSENSTFQPQADSSGSCEELQRNILLSHWNLSIPPSINIAISVVTLVVFAISTGLLWIQSVFIADQFGEEGENSTEQQRAFSWYYFWVNVGVLAGDAGMPILRQTTGFVITLITNAGAIMGAALIFLLGWCIYIKKPHTRVRYRFSCKRKIRKLKNWCSNCTNCRQLAADQRQSLIRSTSTETSGSFGKPKRESVVTRIKEMMPIIKVFFPLTMYWAISYQRSSTWILQGLQMDCRLGHLDIPPDMMPSVEDFLVLLVIPFLDYIVFPHLRNSMNLSIRPIHKLICGMIFGSLSFLMAGLLQVYLSEPAEYCHGDVSITWQLPQLFLLALGDVLVFVTGLEFAYTQAPPDLRNIAIALWLITQGLGTLFNAGIAFLPITLLVSFFFYVGLMIILTLVFVLLNRNYKYREDTQTEDDSHRQH